MANKIKAHIGRVFDQRMRFHSEKVLMKALGISRRQAWQIRHIVKNVFVLTPEFSGPFCDKYESVRNRFGYPIPANLNLAERQMVAINEVLGTHGVETIQYDEHQYLIRGMANCQYRKFWQETFLLYCNTVETYNPTIMYDTCADRFLLGSWGDWYERNIKETNQ